MRMILGHTTWVLMDTPTPGSVWCSTTFILQTVGSGHVLGQLWIFNVSRGCSSEFQFNWSFDVIYSLLLKRTCDFSPTCTAQQIPTPPQQGCLVFFFFCVMWSISRLIIPPPPPPPHAMCLKKISSQCWNIWLNGHTPVQKKSNAIITLQKNQPVTSLPFLDSFIGFSFRGGSATKFSLPQYTSQLRKIPPSTTLICYFNEFVTTDISE